MFQENMDAIQKAVFTDTARPSVQAIASEILSNVKACVYTLERLDEWVLPENPEVEPVRKHWNINIHPVPKGSVLIISSRMVPGTWALTREEGESRGAALGADASRERGWR